MILLICTELKPDLTLKRESLCIIKEERNGEILDQDCQKDIKVKNKRI